jgi:hypothetical protein
MTSKRKSETDKGGDRRKRKATDLETKTRGYYYDV